MTVGDCFISPVPAEGTARVLFDAGFLVPSLTHLLLVTATAV